MTRVPETSTVSKPKAICGINDCIKKFSKSYMKVHQKKDHPVVGNDATADAVIEDEEYNSDANIDDDIFGGTQLLIEAIEQEAVNEALVADNAVVDKPEKAQETEKAYYSMVSHVVTSSFFANKVSPCINYVMPDVVNEQNKVEVKEKETPECQECVKRKEVEENQEKLLKKSDKDNKGLFDKLKSMAGQKRFHVNKSKALEKEVESTRLTLSEMQKRISVLELEKSTYEALKSMTFSPPDNVGASAVPESAPDVVTNMDAAKEQTDSPGLAKTAGRVKCRKCNEKRENLKSLSEHMRAKHPSIQYKCDKCPQKYPFKATLKNHYRVAHTYVSYPCNVCKTNFLTKMGLDVHRSSKCKTPAPPASNPQDVTPQAASPPAAVPPTAASPAVAPPTAASPATTLPAAGPPAAALQAAVLQPGTSHQNNIEWLPRLHCQKCTYYTNTQNELVHHMETRHQQPSIKCDKCPRTFMNSESLVSHIVQQHTQNQQRQRNTIDNGVWKCFFCNITFKGKEERDNHICGEQPFQTEQEQIYRRNKSHEKCKRGPQCHFLKLGKCHFSHAHDVETYSQPQGHQRSTTKKNMWCAYQDKCSKRQTCLYKHIDEERDFVQNIFRVMEC